MPPSAVTFDIDDTVDVVHDMQQLSFWNGHHGERCFLPIHVYDTAAVALSRCCCAPARHHPALRSPAIFAGSCVASAATRLTPTSICAAMAILAVQSRWRGAKGTASTRSLDCRAMPLCTPIPSSSPRPKGARPIARSVATASYGDIPRPDMRRKVGVRPNAASSRASRPTLSVLISASSSPRWPSAARSILRRPLLRTPPGRESDQAPQVPTQK